MNDAISATTGSNAAPGLVRSMLEFNHMPVLYIHPEKLPRRVLQLNVDYERLVASASRRHALSHMLLRLYAIDDDYWYRFDDPLHRLALASVDEMMRCGRTAAALLLSSLTCKVIAKRPFESLVNGIGHDCLTLALDLRREFSEEGDGAPLPTDGKVDLAEAVQSVARDCLATWLAREPRAISVRVRLKFPPDGTPLIARSNPMAVRALQLVVQRRSEREGYPA